MDACSLNEPCSLIGSPSALAGSLRPRTARPSGRSAECSTGLPPSPMPREIGGAYDAGLRAELGQPDLGHLPVRPRGDPLLKRSLGRLAHELPGGRDPPPEDEHARVEDGGESRHALP